MRESFWYEICGLPVRSDVRLRLPDLNPATELEPEWTICVESSDSRAAIEPQMQSAPRRGPGYVRGTAFTTYVDETGTWWWFDSAATVHVSADARLVSVLPEPGADDRTLSMILTGPLAAFVMYRLGQPTLHASAVATPHGAVAFLGASGYGKSTMAAAFANRLEMPLLADDLMPLRSEQDGIYVRPSLPVMKLWATSVENALGFRASGLPNVTAYWDKKFVRLDDDGGLMAHAPARLRAMYVLDRYTPSDSDTAVRIRRLNGRQALTTILAQMPLGSFLQPAEATGFLPFVAKVVRQAPLRVLSYPGDFAHLDATCARILDDVAEVR